MDEYNGFSGAERERGMKIIKQAIKKGILPPLHTIPCEICGQTKGIRHYHNEDYSPKNIIQDAKCLCWRCHMHIHSKYKHTPKWKQYEIEVFQKHQKIYPPVYNKYWTKEWEEQQKTKEKTNV